MDIYGFILNKLPPIYKTENTLKRYRVIAKELEKLFVTIHNLQFQYLIQTADLEHLLILGENVNVKKEDYMTTEIYRKFVQIAYSNLNFVPTHNELMKVIKKVTGLYPTMIPLPSEGPQIENDQGLHITYDIDTSFNTEVLIELEKLVGAGIKIKRDLITRLEGYQVYPASILYNHDIIEIQAEEVN